MNIILYNHAKNIKSESNFEMQSMEIKENQNNEIPFAENCWLVLNIWWTVYNTYYQLTMHVREIYNINDPQNICSDCPWISPIPIWVVFPDYLCVDLGGKVPLKKIKSGFSLEKTWLIFRDEMIYSGLISLQTSEFLPDEILAMLLTFEGYLLAILTVYNMTWIDFFILEYKIRKLFSLMYSYVYKL